jgi:hypothetical protein
LLENKYETVQFFPRKEFLDGKFFIRECIFRITQNDPIEFKPNLILFDTQSVKKSEIEKKKKNLELKLAALKTQINQLGLIAKTTSIKISEQLSLVQSNFNATCAKIEAESEIDKLDKIIKSYGNSGIKINFILQIMECDQEYRKAGTIISDISTLANGITSASLNYANSLHAVKIAQIKDTDDSFNPATILSLTIGPKTIMDSITAGIIFAGSILKNNIDDLVCTIIHTADIGEFCLKKKDIIEITMELKNNKKKGTQVIQPKDIFDFQLMM